MFSILLYSWKFLSEKEEQQSLVQELEQTTRKLSQEKERLSIANESHIDTIKHLKLELEELQLNSKIELSDRQKEVLGYLAYYGREKSYTEIAQEMHISTDGFQTHIHQIKKMLNISGVGGKEQLVDFALDNNFLRYTSLNDTA